MEVKQPLLDPRRKWDSLQMIDSFGAPYENRTRVAVVKEKRFVGILWNFAVWIAS